MARGDVVVMAKLEGMTYALKIAKEQGVEALEKNVKMRGCLKCPVDVSDKQLSDFVKYVKRNLDASYQLVTCICLKECYQFGKERLQRFMDTFKQKEMELLDLDYVGEHYVTLNDYVQYLNEEHGLIFDAECIKELQREFDNYESNTVYHVPKMEKIIEILNENGFQEAAAFLQKKIM